jgi:hypothetical protein
VGSHDDIYFDDRTNFSDGFWPIGNIPISTGRSRAEDTAFGKYECFRIPTDRRTALTCSSKL